MHVCVCLLSRFSRVQLFATLWTVACQASRPWNSPGKNTRVGCRAMPSLPPGDLPNPGTEPISLRSPVLAGRFFTNSATWATVQCKYDL